MAPCSRRAVAVFSLGLLATPLARVGAQARPAACASGRWSEPSPVTLAGGRPIYVEAPYPARGSFGLALLGMPTFVWQSPTVFADTAGLTPATYINPDTLAGAVVDGAGARLVGLPPRTARMLSPRPVALPDGTLDVFWGASEDTTEEARFRVTELWHARFDAGGWGEPQRVLLRTEIDWNDTDPGVGLVGGAAVVAVPTFQRDGESGSSGVSILRAAGTGWRITLVPAVPPPGNVVVDSTPGGGAVVAYLGSLVRPGSTFVQSGVIAVRSSDGGGSWSRAEALVDLGQTRAYALQSALTADGVLHLVWAVDSTRRGGGRAVGRAASADGGRHWRQGPQLPLDAPTEALAVAPMGDRLLLIARLVATRTLLAGVLGGEGPARLTPLAFPAAASLPRLRAWTADSALLVFGVRRAHAYPAFPTIQAPLLLASTFTARCDSVP